VSVADTSHTDTSSLAQSGSAQNSSGDTAKRGSLKPESRACVLHICGGIAMLVIGVALLVIT